MKRRTETNPTNTVHFACFHCRRVYKQQGSSNWDSSVPHRPFPCPNCKRAMTRLGRYFKAPPRRAVRQWEKVELLYRFGERFVAGNSNLDVKCDTLASTIAFLVDAGHAESDVRQCLGAIRKQRCPADDSG